MCASVTFDDGVCYPAWEVETVGELVRRIGGDVVLKPNYANPIAEHCLCAVDVPATAEKHAFSCESDGFDYIFTK